MRRLVWDFTPFKTPKKVAPCDSVGSVLVVKISRGINNEAECSGRELGSWRSSGSNWVSWSVRLYSAVGISLQMRTRFFSRCMSSTILRTDTL